MSEKLQLITNHTEAYFRLNERCLSETQLFWLRQEPEYKKMVFIHDINFRPWRISDKDLHIKQISLHLYVRAQLWP